jgi:hypothetical protein
MKRNNPARWPLIAGVFRRSYQIYPCSNGLTRTLEEPAYRLLGRFKVKMQKW